MGVSDTGKGGWDLEKYDYAHYYKQVYLKEKSQNMQLASQIAEREQSVTLLQQKYERIMGNPVMRLWNKMKRKSEKQTDGGEVRLEDTVCNDNSVSVKQYERTVILQKDPYQYWIGEHEGAVRTEQTVDQIRENMMEKYSITESENRTQIVLMEECGEDFSLDHIEKPYVLFITGQGKPSADALRQVDNFFDKNPQVCILYAAEDRMRERAEGGVIRENPWFKPVYSQETILAFFYFGNVFAIRKEEFINVRWLGSGDWQENIYDFVLKAEEHLKEGGALKEAKDRIVPVDAVLFHKNKEKQDAGGRKTTIDMDETAIDGIWGYEKKFEKIKTECLKRRGYKGWLEESNVPGVYGVCYETGEKVSVIILSKDHPEILEKCIRSIREKTDYPDYEIIVVDNGSYETNRIKSEELSRTYDFKFICEPMDFNFSAMCNIGAKAANGKYLLLLNDDMEVIEGGYMKRMAGQASVHGVGAVGAKLWYPDGLTIQHAGITNLSVGPAHKLVSSPDDRMYYDGRNYFTFNLLAVTAACMMVRKDLYEKAGGMDETMPIAYNDVEFCFRLHKEGYRNVLRNDAILLHHESLSRGLDEADRKKTERLLEEQKRLYRKYPDYEGKDPYYSPWLIQNAPEYKCSIPFEYQKDEVKKALTERNFKKSARVLQEAQLEIHIDDVNILEEKEEAATVSMLKVPNSGAMKITGWSVLKGADNCHYKRSLILEEAEGKKVYTTEIIPYLREDVVQLYQDLGNDGKRIELAGMVARFELKAVEKGSYRVGVLYEDMLSDQMYYRMTERRVEV